MLFIYGVCPTVFGQSLDSGSVNEEKDPLESYLSFGQVFAPQYFDNDNNQYSTSLTLSASYALSENLILSVEQGIVRNKFQDGMDISATDTEVGLTIPVLTNLEKYGRIYSNFSGVISNTRDAKKAGLDGSLSGSIGWAASARKLGFSARLGIQKPFHRDTLNSAGVGNKDYHLALTLGTDAAFTRKVRVAYAYTYYKSYYHVGQIKDFFRYILTYSFQLDDSLSLGAGLINSSHFIDYYEHQREIVSVYTTNKTAIYIFASYKL